MLECAKCGADRSGLVQGAPCSRCGEALPATIADGGQDVAVAADTSSGGEVASALKAGGDWTDDTSPDSRDRLPPGDLDAWRRSAGARVAPPVRSPPPGLRPSRRAAKPSGSAPSSDPIDPAAGGTS